MALSSSAQLGLDRGMSTTAIRRHSSQLTASDALLWDIESDPCLRTTIVAISLLDRSPDWRRLKKRMSEVCDAVPRLHQRVVETPLRLGPPQWHTVENLDLSYHLRRVRAAGSADLREVLDIAGPIAMSAFDKDRPLWEFTLVEGLTGGRAALIQKIHHCLTDGVGAVTLAQLLLDTQRGPSRRSPARLDDAGPTGHGAAASLFDSLSSDARLLVSTPWHAALAMPSLTARSLRNPVASLTTTAAGLRSIGKLLAPVTKPLSPVMTERGLSRRLDSFDIPIAQLRDAAHSADGTVNDAFLAGIAGGMRRYHDRHGARVDELRVTMPINIRKPGDLAGSNHFVPARFTMPMSAAPVGDRMRELGALAKGWRREPALPLADAIAAVLTRLPRTATVSVFGGMLKAIDFVATNVPGLQQRAYLAGAEVVRQYAFAPPSGAALSIALLSHLDQCCIGINIDTAAVPDPEVMTLCLREGFAEVVAWGASTCAIA